jgi:serine phosphatase RsbU (regulator of sigma subunit)
MAFWKKKPSSAGPSTARDDGAKGVDGGDPTDRPSQLLRGDPLEDRKSVNVLLEAIAKVSESRDLESLLDYVVDSSVEATGAERGFLVLIDQDTGEQVVRVARQRGQKDLDGEIKYSTSVVKRVLEEDSPMRTTVQSDAEALELGASVFDLKLRAVMCVPLTPQGTQHREESDLQRGALYVDSKAATREFQDPDLSLFDALAQHIAIALENARLNILSREKALLERSLEIASEIQIGLMPQSPPTLPGLDIFGWFRPAEHATGDFYDFVETRDGRLAVVMGDVTGHGIGPALVTATAQASLRAYAQVLPDPGNVVTMLNKDLAQRMDDGMFLTLFMGVFSADGTLHYVNAGHTPPLLWRQDGGVIEAIANNGPALGMMVDFEYEAASVKEMGDGDTLMTFTDGLIEARHSNRPDRFFDESGVRAVMAEIGLTNPSARELTEALVSSVLEFAGGQREDDMTVVTVRRTGGS